MFINFTNLEKQLQSMNKQFNINAELYNYSDMHDTMSTTKVFRNYVKLYVDEKIALEIKFDKNTHEFKEFMCDAKRSRYVADRLVKTFSFLNYRFTKKQTFVTCDEMTHSRFEAIIFNAVLFAYIYDSNADEHKKLYKHAVAHRNVD